MDTVTELWTESHQGTVWAIFPKGTKKATDPSDNLDRPHWRKKKKQSKGQHPIVPAHADQRFARHPIFESNP
jgi:hypothetical protein